MSYDLRIWETPPSGALPATFEEAARAAFSSDGPGPTVHPKFAALAAQMVAYQGCGEAPWVGDPVAEAQRCTRGVWVFPLPADHRMQLLHVVVQRANALGLAVLDDQLGLALLPPHGVLPQERAGLWRDIVRSVEAAEKETPAEQDAPTLDWARNTMRAELSALLAPQGFISPRQPLSLPYYHGQAQANYFRSTPAGGQAVTLLSSTDRGVPCLTIDINVFSNEIADILRVVFPEHDEMYFRRQLNFYVGLFRGIFAYGHVETRADLQGMVREMQGPVSAVLGITRTCVGMESVMAGTAPFAPTASDPAPASQRLAEHANQTFGYAGLVSAWLYGKDRFDAAARAKRESEVRGVPEPMKEEMGERVDRLVAYLREHVPRKA